MVPNLKSVWCHYVQQQSLTAVPTKAKADTARSFNPTCSLWVSLISTLTKSKNTSPQIWCTLLVIWPYLISDKIYVPWEILEHGLGLVLASFFLARRRSIVGCIFGTALARCSVVIYIRAGGIKRAEVGAIAPKMKRFHKTRNEAFSVHLLLGVTSSYISGQAESSLGNYTTRF